MESTETLTEERTIDNFQERTGFPARATREELQAFGARYLRTDSFEMRGSTHRLEQMQLGLGENNYMWKRIIPESNGSDAPFIIHLEITPNGFTRYPSA